MLTGRVPFPGNTPATLYAHEHRPVPHPCSLKVDLPELVADALFKMLAKAYDDRFSSAFAFVARLREILLTEKQFRERQIHLVPLYQHLQAAVESGNWAEALVLGGQIQALDTDYQDVSQLMEKARVQMRQSPHEIQSQYRIQELLPRRAWIGGGLAALLLIAVLILMAQGGRGDTEANIHLSATPKPTENIVSMLDARPTITPTPAIATMTKEPIITQTESPSATPSLTLAPIPKPTATPTATVTPAYAPTPSPTPNWTPTETPTQVHPTIATAATTLPQEEGFEIISIVPVSGSSVSSETVFDVRLVYNSLRGCLKIQS
jgi:hypothetical protein